MELSRIIENMPCGVLVYRVAGEMKIQYSNHIAWQFFGCESEEEFLDFCAGSYLNLLYRDDRKELEESIRSAQKHQVGKRHRVRYRVCTKNGEVRYIVDVGKVFDDPTYGELVVTNFTEVDMDIKMARSMFHVKYQNSKIAYNLEEYILQNFDAAIEKRYIKVYYQPIVRTINGALCGMEALARWVDPVHGILSPVSFIPLLEEKHMIHKLDLFIIREICRNMCEAQTRGLSLIPVSFNLSRLDFILCDMVWEIEKLVKEYGIARDMLNIEVTESIMIENPQVIRRELDHFQDRGYQIWMDDFGSGYSSLNVLKEYRFDEIKLDMEFLRHFNTRSKNIVKSIVAMAKDIQIRTIAEGVETEEQLAFLKEIGCEKAQGYYIGKPMPIEELLVFCLDRQIQIEDRGWRTYYDKLGQINFITDRALAVTDFDGEKFRYLYVNDTFREVWRSTGAKNMRMVYDNVNSLTSPLSRQFRKFQLSLKVGDDYKKMDYTVRGQYIRLFGKSICEHNGHTLGQVEIKNMTKGDAHQTRERLDSIFRMMYAMYDSIYLIDLKEKRFEFVMQGAFADLPEYSEFKHADLTNVAEISARLFIYADDREEFLEWMDQSTIVERMEREERGYLTQYFRTKTVNGSYVWKAHYVLYIPGKSSLIYSTKYAPLYQERLIEKMAPEYMEKSKTGRILNKNLMESKTINVFWKDTRRRFLGVNQRFLDTYGLGSVSEILGKTDEDMRWNITEHAIREDEELVINTGRYVTNRIGRCIINHISHDILIAKEPLYEDGKIIGLVGYFSEIDEIMKNSGHSYLLEGTDSVTGLMSAKGMNCVILDFVEGWKFRKEDFAIIRLRLPSFSRAIDTYGERISNKILCVVGQILKKEVPHFAAIARTFGARFVICMRHKDRDEITELIERVSEEIRAVHQIENYKVTMYPEVQLNYASEIESVHQLMMMSSGGMDEWKGSEEWK